MAVIFLTSDPKSLLKAFDDHIAQEEPKGKITTWEKLDDGTHYTHKAADWRRKAFFKPSIGAGKLTFNIINPKDQSIAVNVYAYYHGHLIETFLNHFDSKFSEGSATALPISGDIVK